MKAGSTQKNTHPWMAGFTAILFFITNVALAETNNVGFWAERRAARERTHSTPTTHFESSGHLVFPKAGTALDNKSLCSSFKASPLQEDPLDQLVAGLAPWGDVGETHRSVRPNAPVVVHIQDAHGVEEAQRNIAHLLKSLGDRGVTLVGVEGAEGPFTLAPLRDFPNQTITRNIAEAFLKKNLITGSEFAGLTLDKPLTLFGSEDMTLYEKNLKALQHAKAQQPQAALWLKTAQENLERFKKTCYTKDLRRFDQRFNLFHADGESLPSYLRYLLQIAPRPDSPQANRLIKAVTLEESLDFAKVESQRRALADALSKALSPNDLKFLMEQNQAFRSGQQTSKQYHDVLLNICQKNKISLNNSSELKTYRTYLVLADGVDRNKLLEEITRLEQSARERLAKTPDQRRAMDATQTLGLLDKLIHQNLSPEEWKDHLKQHPSQQREPLVTSGPSPHWKTFEDFCAFALQRNHGLVKKTLAQMTLTKQKSAVLVAGGFHTEGIKKLLTDQDISWLVVTPRITKIPETNYLDVLARDPTPLEKLLDGEKIYLTARLELADNRPFLSAFIKKLQNLMAGRISSFQTGNHVFTKGRKASAGELGIRIEGKPYLLKRDPFDAILPELADVLAPLQGGISKIRRSQPKLYYGFVALWEGFVFQYIPYHDLLPLLGTAGTPLLALGLFTLVCAVYWLMHPMMRWTVNKRNPWIKKISLGREILNTWQRTKDHYQRSSLWMVFVLSTLYLLIWIPLGPTPALAVTAVTHATWDYNAAQQRKGDPLISKNIGEQILKNKMAIHPADQVWYVGGDLDGFGALNRALSKTLLGHLPGESDSPDLIEARESIFLNLWTELNKIVRKVTAGEGVVFRGDGGDEFAMVLIGSRDEIQKQLDEIVELFNNAFLNRYDFYSIKGDTPLTDKEVASLHKTITHRFDESFVSLARFSGGLTLAVKKDKTLPASSGLGLDNGFNPLSVDTLKVESPELKVGPFTISLGAISMADVGEQMGDGKSLLDNRQRVPKGEEGSFLPWAEQLGDTVVRRAKHQGKNRGEIWSKDDVAAHRSQFADSASVPSPTPTRAFTHFYLTIKKTIENPLMTFFDLHLGRLHSTPTLIPLKESFIDSLRLFIHQHQGKPVYVYRVGVSGYQSLHEERAFHTLQEQISHIDGDIVIAGLVDFLSTVFKVENFTKSNAGWVRPDSFYFFTDKKIPQESLRVEELIALVKSRLLKHNPSISQEKIYQDFNPTLVVYETIIKKGWLFKEKINEAIDSLDLMNDVFIMGVGHQIKNTVEHQSTSLRSSSLIGSPDERFDFAGFPVSLTSNRQNGTIVTRGGIFPTSNRRKKISSPILAFQIKDQCIWVTALPATKKGLTHILEMEQGENQTKALAEIEASLPPKARKSVEPTDPESESETGQDFEDRFTEPSRQAFIMETTLLGGKASQVDWTLDRFTEIIQTHLRDDSFAPTGTRFLALTPEISVGASDEETITTIDLDPLWDNRPDQTVPNLLTAHVAHELDEILVSDTKRTLVVHTSGPQTVKQIKHLLEARFPGLRNLMGQVGDRFVCVNNGAENGQTHLSSILRRTTGHPPQKIKATIRVVAEDPTLIAWDEFDRKQVILIPVLKDFIERIQRSFREIHHRLKQA